MTDFSVDLAGPQAAGSAVLSPVQKIDTTTPLLKAGASIFTQTVKDERETKKQEAQNAVLGGVLKEVDRINQGMASGQIKGSVGTAMLRSLKSKSFAAHPEYTEDLKKAFTAVGVKETESDVAFEQQKAARKREQALITEANKTGLFNFTPDMGDEAKEEELQDYRQYLTGSMSVQELYERKELSRDLSDIERQSIGVKTDQSLNDMTSAAESSAARWISTDLKKAINSGASASDLNLMLDQKLSNYYSSIEKLRPVAKDWAASATKRIDDLKTIAKDMISGDADATLLGNRIKSQKNRDLLAAMSSPDIRKLMVFKEIIPSNIPLSNIEITPLVANGIAALPSYDPADPEQKKNTPQVVGKNGQEDYFKVSQASNREVNSGTIKNTPEALKQTRTKIYNELDQLGDLSHTNPDLRTLTPAVEYFADRSFIDVAEKVGIDKGYMEKAGKTFNRYWMQGVQQGIQKVMTKNIYSVNGQPVSMQDLLEIVPTGAGIKVNIKDVPEGGMATQIAFGAALSDVRLLEQALNTTVRAGAHLSGYGKNYSKYWEDAKGSLIPELFPATPIPEANAPLGIDETRINSVFNSLISAESSGRQFDSEGNILTSEVGAEGISQVMPDTQVDPGYGVKPMKDKSREEFIRFGNDYLRAMLKEFKGEDEQMEKALAAYNAGPGNVKKAIKEGGEDWRAFLPKPKETLPYIRKILKGAS